MSKLKNILWLELYAVALAAVRVFGGVHTDEAKYLLNIPYPHPPLIRYILHLTDSWAGQEFFWRLVFASLLVQAVWLLLRLIPDAKPKARASLSIAWLLGSAILLQAGSIMMAPLTALEALLFIYLYLRDEDVRDNAAFVGLLWLMSLFTAYQIVLFFPIVWVLLRRTKSARWVQALCFAIPIVLLGVYSLSNPLTLASVLIHGDSDTVALTTKLWELMYVWFLGGSVVLSVVGLYGILRNKMWPLLLSFLLVVAYIFLARFSYYAILFLPLSVGGFIALLRKRQMVPTIVASGVVAFSVVMCALSYSTANNPARRVMQALSTRAQTGAILINGEFGHEWQYESQRTVLRYRFTLLPLASAVVCLKACSDLDQLTGWRQIQSQPPLVYVQP